MTVTADEVVTRTPVIPVLTLTDPDTAVPLAKSLAAGGLAVLEITLRTPAALTVLTRIAAEVPGALVGAGTVCTPRQATEAVRAGAQFLVSPGSPPALLRAMQDTGAAVLPGVATATEVLTAQELGANVLKLFPATQVGGIPLLKALAGPFPDVRFCPTGGITETTAPDYLALPNVACVGGSWLATAEVLRTKDWKAARQLARRAAALQPLNCDA